MYVTEKISAHQISNIFLLNCMFTSVLYHLPQIESFRAVARGGSGGSVEPKSRWPDSFLLVCSHIVYSRHGESKEKVEGEEGKESGEKIHSFCALRNVNGMFVVEETHDQLLTIELLASWDIDQPLLSHR